MDSTYLDLLDVLDSVEVHVPIIMEKPVPKPEPKGKGKSDKEKEAEKEKAVAKERERERAAAQAARAQMVKAPCAPPLLVACMCVRSLDDLHDTSSTSSSFLQFWLCACKNLCARERTVAWHREIACRADKAVGCISAFARRLHSLAYRSR